MIRRLVAIALVAMLPSLARADVAPFPYVFQAATRATATQTAGGTSQQLLAYNALRKMFCVQNPAAATESYWVDYGRAAVVGTSEEVPAGTQLCFGGSGTWQGAITGNATTTGHTVIVFEFQ